MDRKDIQRLGINRGGYFGERIHIRRLLRELEEMAIRFGWTIDRMAAERKVNLFACRRRSSTAEQKIYLSAGIHGDEPAGPLAIHQLVKENTWPANVDLWICPCLNPEAFERNSREDPEGIDLNRDYRAIRSFETRAHIAWLQKQPRFDLSLCLHEDWESRGFYVYELNNSGRLPLAGKIIDAVQKVCPIDFSSQIEGRPAQGGVINPIVDPKNLPEWPEALYLLEHHSPQSCTLEAPSDFPLDVRVRALVTGTKAALAGL